MRLFAGFRDPRLEFGDRISSPESELGHFESLTRPDQVGSSLFRPDPIPAGIADAARRFPALLSSRAPEPSAMRSTVGGLSDQVTVEQMSRRQLNLAYRHLFQLLATAEAHRQALVVLVTDLESSLLRLSRELEQRDVQNGMLENDLIARKQDIKLKELLEKRKEDEYQKGSKQVHLVMTGLGEELNQAIMDGSKREEEARRQMEEKTREWQHERDRFQEEITQLKETNSSLQKQEKKKEEEDQIALKQANFDIKELREELNQVLMDESKREEEARRQMEEKTSEWQYERDRLQEEIRELNEMNLSLLKQKSTMRKQRRGRSDYESGSDDVNPSTSSLAPEDSSGFVSCGNLSDVDVGQLGEETGVDDRKAHYGSRLHEENRKLKSDWIK